MEKEFEGMSESEQKAYDKELIKKGICRSPYTTDRCPYCVDTCEAMRYKFGDKKEENHN